MSHKYDIEWLTDSCCILPKRMGMQCDVFAFLTPDLWEGTDEETGEGNGVYRRRKHAPSEPTWIAYVAAAK